MDRDHFPGSSGTTHRPPSTRHLSIRGTACRPQCGFDHQGNLFMAKTFMYAEDTAKELSVNSTKTTFWTAPGARTASCPTNRTTLEHRLHRGPDPYPPEAGRLRELPELPVLAARLLERVHRARRPNRTRSTARVAERRRSLLHPEGVLQLHRWQHYRQPRPSSGRTSLNVNGGAFLGLTPDARTAISSPTGAVALIR